MSTATEISELDALLSSCRDWHEVGSRVTCNPPPADTDRDVLCEVLPGLQQEFVDRCKAAGFEPAGYVPHGDESKLRFVSLRRGVENWIVTDDHVFARLFMVATKLATRFNLMAKDDRIALFQAVLYGNG